MSKVKNQHQVPQVYLRRFANARGNMYAFDKVTRRSYECTVRDAASETYFYDFSEAVMQHVRAYAATVPESELPADERQRLLDPQLVEKDLSQMEGSFAAALTDVDQSLDATGCITQPQKAQLAYFIMRQMLRGRDFRDLQLEAANKLGDALAQILVAQQYGPSEVGKVRVSVDERYVAAMHARMLYDEQFNRTIMDVLQKRIWIIGVNDTGQPLYTSDCPVIWRSHEKQETYGVASPGVEVMFPLSPRYAISMFDRDKNPALIRADCKSIPLEPDHVLYYNSGQVIRSYRHVYSSTAQFELAADVCAHHPEVCDPKRERVQVASGLATPNATDASQSDRIE